MAKVSNKTATIIMILNEESAFPLIYAIAVTIVCGTNYIIPNTNENVEIQLRVASATAAAIMKMIIVFIEFMRI